MPKATPYREPEATAELLERCLRVQRCNRKCAHESGYVLGDMTQA